MFVGFSYEEVKHYIEVESNSGCKLLSDKYKDSITKLSLLCSCGNKFETTLKVFKRGSSHQCKECSKEEARKKSAFTYEDVKRFIEIESNCGCKLISSEYISSKKKIKIQCKCENEFETTFSKFKHRGKRQCNKCGQKIITQSSYKWDLESAKLEFKKRNLQPLFDEYINNMTKYPAKTEDGYMVEISLANVLKGNNPYIFSKYNKYTIDNIKLWLIKNNINCELLSDRYVNNTKKIKFKCSHGHIFEIAWVNFKIRKMCPICNISKGESEIARWCEKNKITYKSEYSFDYLTGANDGLLRFDFAIFDNNNHLKYLIEYDGELHYEPARFSKDEEKMLDKLKQQQKNDALKNQYCKDNNITLLRIPYWEFDNIEQILDACHSVFFNANF